MPQVESLSTGLRQVRSVSHVSRKYLRPKLARNPNTAREINLQSRRRTISFGSSTAFTMALSLTLLLLLLVLLQIRRHGFHCSIPLDLTA